MNIRILPEAERDLELGADFYESQRKGLGRYFNDSLLADIESLQIYAGVHERVHNLFRCLSKARWGMREHVDLLKQQGLKLPPQNSNPKVTIRNEQAPID